MPKIITIQLGVRGDKHVDLPSSKNIRELGEFTKVLHSLGKRLSKTLTRRANRSCDHHRASTICRHDLTRIHTVLIPAKEEHILYQPRLASTAPN